MPINHIESLKKAYEQSPDNNTLLFILLDQLYQAGEYEQALTYLQKTTRAFDESTHRVLAGMQKSAGGFVTLSPPLF